MNKQNEYLCKLKELRLSRGMTQKQLSEKSGVSVSAISAYETGRNNICNSPFTVCKKLAEALECEFEEILVEVE